MMRRLLLVLSLLYFVTSASASDEALWLRSGVISPDGSQIAFVYHSNIFIVSSEGGTARQLTANPAHDSDPVWTPDGESIVFASDRELSKDLWIVSARGGSPRRISTWSGSETPLAVGPDGLVYFKANIQPDPEYVGFPGYTQLYAVSLSGGRPKRVSSVPMSEISIGPDGSILYEDIKGPEDPLRKHHLSSTTRDIWYFNPSKEEFRKLSSFQGEDRKPLWCADGDSFYYLSEQGGNFNVWRSSLSQSQTRVQITRLPTHPVRNLSLSNDGLMLFSYNGALYTCREGSEPQRLSISVKADQYSRDIVRRSIMSGISSIAASEGGKELALVAHGDVYVCSSEARISKRITDTAEQERGVSFSKDGRSLYYASERDGHWAIYRAYLKNKEDQYFSTSYDFCEERFTSPGQTCFQPQVSPDGKWVAFLRDRSELVIKSTESSKELSLLRGANYSNTDGDLQFAWAPDSKHLLSTYCADGAWNNRDIAVIDIDDGSLTNLTRSGYSDRDFKWALGGKAMLWKSDRNGYRSHGSWGAEGDIYIMFFDAEAYSDFLRAENEEKILKLTQNPKEKAREDKKEAKDSLKAEKGKVEKLKLDLEHRDDRCIRLTQTSGRLGDYFMSPDGTKLYYSTRLEKSTDLCCLDTKKFSVSVVSKGTRGPFFLDRDGKYVYSTGLLSISRIDMNTAKSNGVLFSSEYNYKAREERAYIFEHCWRQVKERFYDPALHGVDWEAMHDNYAQFLPYIDNNYEFQDLLSEMLGELNASHTGARYSTKANLNTGHIGVLFDQNCEGEGLKIAEILPGSILQIALPSVKEGDIITAVDGEKIGADKSWYDALWMKSSKRIRLDIKQGRKTQTVYLTPTSSDSEALYKRWVRGKERLVESLSEGKLGYVHIRAMDSDSYRELYLKALGKYRTCEALIVDTRHNGGGWLHDDLVSFLGGKAYAEFRPRGQYIGTEPYSKWTKPSCVVMNEANYSDASGFPYSYRVLGLGKLIGTPVPGTMTAVWWERQIDNSIVYGIPQVTVWGLEVDRALENYQIEPDVLIYNEPGALSKGIDQQIEAAVKELLERR